MEKLRFRTKIHKDGHLKIDMPTSLKKGEVEVMLIIESDKKGKNKYNFSDIAGKLSWEGNALEVQKELRDKCREKVKDHPLFGMRIKETKSVDAEVEVLRGKLK